MVKHVLESYLYLDKIVVLLLCLQMSLMVLMLRHLLKYAAVASSLYIQCLNSEFTVCLQITLCHVFVAVSQKESKNC